MAFLRISSARSCRGAVSTLILSLVVASAFFVCSCAFDLVHIASVKRQMKQATDSAALCGAQALARDPVSAFDCDQAVELSLREGASFRSDSIPFAPSAPDTTVSVSINSTSFPRTATVRMSRTVANTFFRSFGIDSQEVRSESTAWAYKGVTTLSPGQAYPMAVMLDHVPSEGPQAGMPLSEYVGEGAALRPFTIVLAPGSRQNAVWLKVNRPWIPHSVAFGQTTEPVEQADWRDIMRLKAGDRLLLPLIRSRPASSVDNVTIIGVIGFEVAEINAADGLTGYINDPVVVSGKPGTPILTSISIKENLFLSQHSPWKVQLVK